LLGGDVVCLLTDLFVSGTGGPNLRAAMAHGPWDDCIQNEIENIMLLQSSLLATDDPNQMSDNPLNGWEVVDLLLLTFTQIAVAVQNQPNTSNNTLLPDVIIYRPSYSFTASTLNSLQHDYTALVDTRTIISLLDVDLEYMKAIPNSISSRVLVVLTDHELKAVFEKVASSLSSNTDVVTATDTTTPSPREWLIDCIYAEYEMNKILEPLGASRQLLIDIKVALQSLTYELHKAHDSQLIRNNHTGQRYESTRQRNRLQRIAACSEFAYDMYSFAFLIAVFSFQNALQSSGVVAVNCNITTCLSDKEWVKVVERTRMVLSTFSNFLICNVDRSFKAADQYIKGSLVQKIIGTIKAQGDDLLV
jgi:hypothetical protein